MASIVKCSCGGDSTVIDTRRTQFGTVKRIRRCDRCGAKWRTEEISARNIEVIAVKREDLPIWGTTNAR